MIRIFVFLCCVLLSSFTVVYADGFDDLDLPPNVTFQFPTKNMQEKQIYKGTSNEIKAPQNYQTVQTQNNEEKGVKGFFNKLFNRGNKKTRPQFDDDIRGYQGHIPNIESQYGYRKPKSSTSKENRTGADDYTPEEFLPSKIDDPLFLDVILSKEKPSQYTVDMLRVMKFLESFRTIIANHESIQKFNANVNILDLHARRIEQLYANKPEGMSPSYWLLIDLAYKAKVLGNLKFDANYYSKFSPVTGTQYDPANILTEDNKLLIDLDKTVFAIRQLNN